MIVNVIMVIGNSDMYCKRESIRRKSSCIAAFTVSAFGRAVCIIFCLFGTTNTADCIDLTSISLPSTAHSVNTEIHILASLYSSLVDLVIKPLTPPFLPLLLSFHSLLTCA
jgi:hypothetical protein